MNKLYLAYIGWDSENRLIEDHDIVLVVASDAKEAKQKAKQKTKLLSGVHVDIMMEIKNIDGFDILLEKSDNKEEITKVLDYYTQI